jgi:hypothetical protein
MTAPAPLPLYDGSRSAPARAGRSPRRVDTIPAPCPVRSGRRTHKNLVLSLSG